MATYTIFGDTGDGQLTNNYNAATPSADWPHAYSQTPATSSSISSSTCLVGNQDESTKYAWGGNTSEFFLKFDTSSIADTDTITGVACTIYCSSFSNPYFDCTLELSAYPWTTLTTSNWQTPTQLSALTMVANLLGNSWVNGDGTANTLVEVGTNFRSTINVTGYTTLVLATSYQRTNTNSPAWGSSVFYGFYTADQTGTSRDPKLVVTTTSAIIGSATGSMMGVG